MHHRASCCDAAHLLHCKASWPPCSGTIAMHCRRRRAPRREVTIRTKDKATSLVIAHLAGVSQPTVSRALRGSPMVNEVTRARILKIARELNYKVDKNASSLRSKYRGTLALLFFKDPAPDDSLINPFFVSMLASITHACAQRGYDLLLSFQHGADEDWQADFEDSHNSDGIILLG